MRSTALRALAPLALMGLIFYLSAQPSVGPELPAFTRVVAHFTEYAVLAALWAWALVPRFGTRGLWIAAAICVAYAVTDEIHQSYVDGRDSDPLDVLTDCAGAATALLAITARRARARRQAGLPTPR
jgi:VanZ family protein